MDSEDKNKLQRALELGEDNNKMLRKLVRAMRWAKLIRVIYILLIVGSAIGAYYFSQPYLEEVMSSYGSVRDSISSFNDVLNQ